MSSLSFPREIDSGEVQMKATITEINMDGTMTRMAPAKVDHVRARSAERHNATSQAKSVNPSGATKAMLKAVGRDQRAPKTARSENTRTNQKTRGIAGYI